MLTFPPDFSFVIQIASFLLLWFGLKRLLFDPVLQVLEEREARTSGLKRDATEIKASVEVSAAEYERRMQEVRRTLATEMESARGATQEEERRVVLQAREQAGSELAQLRENVNRQADAARPTLASEAQALSTRILERVIGRALA